MATQKRQKKQSPAQAAAGQAFAAAGRRAQARKRAQSIKKTGKPPPLTKRQRQADLRNLARARAAQARKRAGGAALTPKTRGAAAPEELLVHPGARWPAGCNDIAPACASVALACHLQAVTGFTVTDAEILKLHRLAGGDNGAAIGDVLETARDNWLTFGGGRVRLLSFFQVDETFLLAGMIVGITLGHEGHAVLSTPSGMVSWGREMPWEGEPEEAWAIEWGI